MSEFAPPTSSEPRTRVLLIRHAEVENPQHVLYGHLDGFGLSARGRLQAETLGRRLRDSGLRRIVHSPLQRAVETADLINRQLPEPVPLEPEPALREAEFSRYLQGLPYWQIPVRRPLWFVHRTRRGLVPGDETVDQMGGRVLQVVHRLAADHPGELSALVSHADPLQATWVLLDHRPRTDREMVRKSVGRAGVLAVDLEGSRIVGVEYWPTPEVTVEAQPAAAAS
ncbi:MAG: histidine phosphatase family protein [Candidatus Dormibacteraeota bacterium]|nr:histidine phosphatase family protein [Candidatus Dormibacteraeota bacterium]